MRVLSGIPLLGAVAVVGMALLLPAQAPAPVERGRWLTTGRVPSQGGGVLTEVSGLEWSRCHPRTLWVHEDQGRGAWLTAMTTEGRFLRAFLLSGASNTDWEDIALGPGPKPGVDYLYVADIGNNDGRRATVTVFRAPEPRVLSGKPVLLRGTESFSFRYPDQSHDAETFFVDPFDGRGYIVTKESPKSKVGYLYSCPLPWNGKKVQTLKLEGTFPHESPNFSAGDMAPDGRMIYLRRPKEIYAWTRPEGTSVLQALRGEPTLLGGGKQGNAEALAISPAGLWMITTSEAKGARLFGAGLRFPGDAAGQRVAAWWHHGPGFPLDGPTIGLLGRPVLGAPDPVRVAVTYPKPNAAVILAVSRQPLRTGRVPFGAGWALVVPQFFVRGTLDENGHAVFGFGKLPELAVLHGERAYGQAVVADRAVEKGMALSPGLTVQAAR